VGAQARTIVPDNAVAAIDIRLVPESNPDRLIGLVRDHIESKGYTILDKEPTKEQRLTHAKLVTMTARGGVLPFRTDLNAPIGKWLNIAIKNSYNEDPINIRIMGGTVPMAPFIKALKVPAVIVPMVNADNNQHSPNENVKIGYLVNAMKTFNAIFTTPFDKQ
jgi:acetylornithine deacetylase/succinyl-diaminopimelate desuccinylase-like protein